MEPSGPITASQGLSRRLQLDVAPRCPRDNTRRAHGDPRAGEGVGDGGENETRWDDSV